MCENDPHRSTPSKGWEMPGFVMLVPARSPINKNPDFEKGKLDFAANECRPADCAERFPITTLVLPDQVPL
jgi:hypothetical protein